MQTNLPETLPTMLPETLNFIRQVELNRKLEGSYPLAKMARLSAAALNSDGSVEASFRFGRCVGYACLQASASTQLLLECQRCLQPMKVEVSGDFKFALLTSEEEFNLVPKEFEPYLLKTEEQSLIDLIEDELLLSLPMVTVHTDTCSDYMTRQNNTVQDDMQAAKASAHPFSALKALISDTEKNDAEKNSNN